MVLKLCFLGGIIAGGVIVVVHEAGKAAPTSVPTVTVQTVAPQPTVRPPSAQERALLGTMPSVAPRPGRMH